MKKLYICFDRANITIKFTQITEHEHYEAIVDWEKFIWQQFLFDVVVHTLNFIGLVMRMSKTKFTQLTVMIILNLNLNLNYIQLKCSSIQNMFC